MYRVGPVEEVNKVPERYNKTLPFYDNLSESCNFYVEEGLTTAPWPKDCRVYSYTNSCNRYEISRDGKSIDSCDLKEEPECISEPNF